MLFNLGNFIKIMGFYCWYQCGYSDDISEKDGRKKLANTVLHRSTQCYIQVVWFVARRMYHGYACKTPFPFLYNSLCVHHFSLSFLSDTFCAALITVCHLIFSHVWVCARNALLQIIIRFCRSLKLNLSVNSIFYSAFGSFIVRCIRHIWFQTPAFNGPPNTLMPWNCCCLKCLFHFMFISFKMIFSPN